MNTMMIAGAAYLITTGHPVLAGIGIATDILCSISKGIQDGIDRAKR